MGRRRKIGFFIFDGLTALDLVGLMEAFGAVRNSNGTREYEILTFAKTRREITAENGLVIRPSEPLANVDKLDTIVIPNDLIRSVLRQGIMPALVGWAIGLVTAIAAVRGMQSMLFEMKPLDPTVFALVGCALLIVSFAASLIPALRTTGIDPAQTLRAE